MSAIDATLVSIAHQAISVCRSVSDALARVLKNDGGKNSVTLSLQSRYGALFKVPDLSENKTLTLCTHPLLESLYSAEEEDRIALLLGAREWNMVSCFSLFGLAFYPLITIPAPPSELRWVRYELLAALDCFSLNCRQALRDFLFGAQGGALQGEAAGARQGAREKHILESLVGYSEQVDCAALIDNDGFVLLAVGQEEKADEIAGNLALFNRHAIHDLDNLGAVRVHSLSLGGHAGALLIGRTPGKNVSLALSVNGARASVVARFLFDAGVMALQSLASVEGTLGDYSDAKPAAPLRIRDSWLSTPKIVPQAAFVSVAGKKVFHSPQCVHVLETDERTLAWLDTRAEAIRAGLVPCAACNP